MAVPERGRRDDALVEIGPALERAPRFADLLELSPDEQAALDEFEALSPNGRPVGAQDFIAMVETKLGRTVRPGSGVESRMRGEWIDMGEFVSCPRDPSPFPRLIPRL
jgi:hypothetical protein